MTTRKTFNLRRARLDALEGKVLTPQKFVDWMVKHGLTNVQAGRILGYAARDTKSACPTISRICNGTWAGWNKPMEIIGLKLKMDFVQQSFEDA